MTHFAPDLFSYARSYPNAPGHQRTDTSRAAARSMAGEAPTLQRIILDSLAVQGPAASFELATRLSRSYRAVQPRTSELRRQGKIVDSGDRREDPETGRMAIVWRVA